MENNNIDISEKLEKAILSNWEDIKQIEYLQSLFQFEDILTRQFYIDVVKQKSDLTKDYILIN
jgi:hypothetical protein